MRDASPAIRHEPHPPGWRPKKLRLRRLSGRLIDVSATGSRPGAVVADHEFVAVKLPFEAV